VDVTDPLVVRGGDSYVPGVSERNGGVTKFVHTDYLGSARLMTDSTGAVTDSWRYDAYGNVKSHTGSSTTKLSFARQWGYQQDSGGLQLLGHRYYESDTGVFLSRDPALDGGNWFGYCSNNPHGRIDPDGLEKITLPKDPSGLPKGWTRLPHGGDEGAELWLAPGGKEGLEFHPGKEGLPKWRGKDHWHKSRRGKNGRMKKEKTKKGHLEPGDVVEIDTGPIVGPPEPENMWKQVDWEEAGRRTTIAISIGGVIFIFFASGGSAAGAGIPAGLRFAPILLGGG